MTFNIVDIVFVVIIAGFALSGLWFGLVHSFGSLLGTIFSVYIASRYYETVLQWVVNTTGWGDNLSRITVFIVLFFVLNRIFGLLFAVVDKILKIITRLPFISSLNKLLGAVFGLMEGMLTVGLIIYFVERFPLSEKIMDKIAASSLAPYGSKAAQIFLPFLPDTLKILKSTVDYIENVFIK